MNCFSNHSFGFLFSHDICLNGETLCPTFSKCSLHFSSRVNAKWLWAVARQSGVTGVPYASTVFFPPLKVYGLVSTNTNTTPCAPSLAKETAIGLPNPHAPPVTKAAPVSRRPDLLVVDINFTAVLISSGHSSEDQQFSP